MQLLRRRDPQDFAELVTPFLLRDEAAHNLILGLLSVLQQEPTRYAAPYLATVREDEEVVLVALRTPPHNLILSRGETGALEPLLQDLQDADLPGVLGPKMLAKAFVEAWRQRTGQTVQLNMAQRIYRLERVMPVYGVPGKLRLARARDGELLTAWTVAFSREAMHSDERESELLQTARHVFESYLRHESLYVWEFAGEVVSMAGFGGPTPHGIRVSLVYTPPEKRGHGYASACVAALSQKLLDEGRAFCFLFTDLANPTSNKIYRFIGYEPACDVDEYRFLSPG